jgi:hypothetical protein
MYFASGAKNFTATIAFESVSIGGEAAPLVLRWLLGPVGNFGVTVPALPLAQSFVVEAGYTCVLGFVIMGVATDERTPVAVAPFAIGATVCAGALVTGPLSGGSFSTELPNGRRRGDRRGDRHHDRCREEEQTTRDRESQARNEHGEKGFASRGSRAASAPVCHASSIVCSRPIVIANPRRSILELTMGRPNCRPFGLFVWRAAPRIRFETCGRRRMPCRGEDQLGQPIGLNHDISAAGTKHQVD